MSKKRKLTQNDKQRQNRPKTIRQQWKEAAQIFDVLPVSAMNVSRYTFDAWRSCYPGSTRLNYEERQKPYNLMESLAFLIHDWPEKRLE